MPFQLQWTLRAQDEYDALSENARRALETRRRSGRAKSSREEGLFKQIAKALRLLAENPKHPGLHTHEYSRLKHPYDPRGKVWEAYAQNKTPAAHRIFWCYGPKAGQITILAITPHP